MLAACMDLGQKPRARLGFEANSVHVAHYIIALDDDNDVCVTWVRRKWSLTTLDREIA